MHRYVEYLRQPRSRPLTIRQYNSAQNDLLDENPEFQSLCLNAWNIGQATRKGNPNAPLTNSFPDPPELKTCGATRIHANQMLVVRPKMNDVTVDLTHDVKASLKKFAEQPELGVPANIKSFVHPTSAAAVSSLLNILDFNQRPVMYT